MKRVEGEMLIVGTEPKLTAWQRFARVQRRAQLLARGKGFRPGVYRFKTHEEQAAWILANRKV